MRTIFRKLKASQTGATAVEYGLIVALIAIAIAGSVSKVGEKVLFKWSTVVNEVNKS